VIVYSFAIAAIVLSVILGAFVLSLPDKSLRRNVFASKKNEENLVESQNENSHIVENLDDDYDYTAIKYGRGINMGKRSQSPDEFIMLEHNYWLVERVIVLLK